MLVKEKNEQKSGGQEFSYEKWVEELESLQEKDRKDFIIESLRNKAHSHIFGRYFFPHIIQGTNEVPECHKELIEELNKKKDSAIIFPRGFAKSTWEKIDTIHDIIYKSEQVILYISVTITDAQFHFESIKAEFENNELLRSVYGNLVPDYINAGKKWTNTHFETTNGINVVARGSCKGRGVNIKNQRPTKIICDDIEEDEQVRSAERREKLHNWLYNVIFPSRDKNLGKIKMIGTVLHRASEIVLFYERHGGIFKRAIENGKSIWESYWSLEDLDKEREKIGTRAFTQEFMNNPTDSDLANFKPEWIDENIYTILPRVNSLWWRVITVDPQAGESSLSDEFAITDLRFQRGSTHRYVEKQIAGRESVIEQAKKTILCWLEDPLHTLCVGVEKVMNQTALYQTLLDWKSFKIEIDGLRHIKDRNIPVRAITPEGKDKVARLQMHEPEFERGEIHLRPEMKELRDQILFLGTKVLEHDDRADSLIMALDLANVKEEIIKGSEETQRESKMTVAGNIYKEKF